MASWRKGSLTVVSLPPFRCAPSGHHGRYPGLSCVVGGLPTGQQQHSHVMPAIQGTWPDKGETQHFYGDVCPSVTLPLNPTGRKKSPRREEERRHRRRKGASQPPINPVLSPTQVLWVSGQAWQRGRVLYWIGGWNFNLSTFNWAGILCPKVFTKQWDLSRTLLAWKGFDSTCLIAKRKKWRQKKTQQTLSYLHLTKSWLIKNILSR